MTVTPELMNATAAKYRNGTLFVEDTSLAEIADAVGTPVYVYSSEMLKSQYQQLDNAWARCRISYTTPSKPIQRWLF